ncbi:MAG: ATP-binding cassette domain-containing protein [Lysobacterales bacterium]
MTAAVEIVGAGKRFGDIEALTAVDASIEAGHLTGLVGPDGAGKTTLLRMLAALMTPTSGHISVAGFDVVEESAAVHECTGYMPQRFGLYEDLSVIENLRLYADLRGVNAGLSDSHSDHGREHVFGRLLRFTQLEPFQDRLAGRLSGGMKQKLGLACALMGRPKVLLLDEPSVGVDPVSRRELWKMVGELTDEGMAVVWSTAYLDEAESCESVLLLNAGRIEFAGDPSDLTGRLAGRSFRIRDIAGDRRRVLAETLDLEQVCDGVIQGESVRAVLRDGAAPGVLERVATAHGARVEPVAPRFEDAFIDLLGGGPGGHSAIAEKMPEIALESGVPVACRELSKRFGAFVATDAVSFEVRRGEIFGLLGPNGAGKSTTFKMLCGLLKPSAGEAIVEGHDLRYAPSQAKLEIGYMAQKFSLYGLLSVRQNLEFFAGVYGLRGAARNARILEMIRTFELEQYLDASPDSLPLGFKQRLALSCALMHRPPILFLDEPTSGVDPVTRREFWTHINGLVRRGVTVLVTTHFMDEAEYCDRVALMYRAKIIALDSPDRLKGQAATAAYPDPTMEEAFIALIEAANIPERRAA